MILRLLTLALLAAPPFVRAADVATRRSGGPTLAQRQMQEVDRLLKGKKFDPACWVDTNLSGKTCNQTSDEFCKALWDTNDGNMDVFDGTVRAGNSEKSGLSLAQLDDYRALVNAKSRLPADLKRKAGQALDQLGALLDAEKNTKAWKRGVADAYRAYQQAVDDVKENREKKDKDAESLDADIVKAKYASSENWKRVERLFPQAKTDLLRVIDTLNMSEERKEHMRERVRTVTLTLPDGSDDCGTTQVNAFYTAETHKFTVCAGLFNTYQTDSGLFQTIAHEISHSIDPNAESVNDYRNGSPVAEALRPLAGAKGQAMPCDEWEKVNTKVLALEPGKIRRSELDQFYSCLEPRNRLKEWNEARVDELAEMQARGEMNEPAKQHVFTNLAKDSFVNADGEVEPNEKFLRPDLVEDELTKQGEKRRARVARLSDKAPHRDANIAEIFTQILTCEKENSTGTLFQQVKDRNHKRGMFEEAMEKTYEIVKKQKRALYSFCGQNCDELVASGYSRDSSEAFADWMANRASRFFYARIDTPEHRRESAALGNALLCDEAGPQRDAPEFTAAEKKWSTEEHPDDRVRRVSEYEGVVAHQLGCTIDFNQGFAPCEP